MKKPFLALLFAAPAALALFSPADASACGACVVPASENTVVSGHRMALSVSPKQTVLWDQIQYSGDPESWGWILPVKPGAVVELSNDAWFEALDAATTASVFQPIVNCGGGSNVGCGCADVANDAGQLEGTGSGGDGPQVTVVHRGTVGPFETVTLSTETPGVLDDWLKNAGFTIPADSAPVIDAYVKEGFDFIALKLQPDQGVDQMKPVRVVQPGASPTLPLRMVSIGTGANVAITLFLITEGRWAAKNFTNTEVPLDLLSWDFADSTSNYSELRQKLLAQNGGAAWLTSFARKNSILGTFNRSVTGGLFFGFGGSSTQQPINSIAKAYIQQGNNNAEANDTTCISAFDAFATSSQMVVDPCPPGVSSTDPSCTDVGQGEIDARLFECGALDDLQDSTLDDLSVALNGLHPKDVWLTRLEADLPRAALANDLIVEPAASQDELDSEMRARHATNIDTVCGSGVILPPGVLPNNNKDKGTFIMVLSMFGATVLAFARRRLRTSEKLEPVAS